MSKKQIQKLKILRTERAFEVKQKEFFIILKDFQLPDLRVRLERLPDCFIDFIG